MFAIPTVISQGIHLQMTKYNNKPVFVTQWNVRKMKSTVEELQKLSTMTQSLFLITEPSTNSNRTITWNIKGYNMYYTYDTSKPVNRRRLTRSCIVCPKSIPATFLKALSDSDQTVITLETNPKIGVISCYLDILKDAVNQKLTTAIAYFKSHNIDFIISSDCNSWSPMWGSPQSNDRGEMIEELILSEDLHVANVGNSPTWRNTTGSSSIIDITIQSKPNLVSEWHVEDALLSDHDQIKFALHTKDNNEIISKGRPYKRANWKEFRKILKASPQYHAESWDWNTVELAVTDLYKEITIALDAVAPIQDIKIQEKLSWWNSNVADMRKKAKKICKLNRKGKRTHAQRKEANREYRKLLRSTQNSNWEELCTSQDSIQSLSKLHNRAKGSNDKAIEQVKLNGRTSESSVETIGFLMDAHFGVGDPGAPVRVFSGPIPNRSLRLKWINKTTITETFKSFGPFKMVGPGDFKPIVLQNLPGPTIESIRKIYTACIKLHYTPSEWKRALINWIPKMGKEDYSNPLHFRPITLSSFLLKGVEKHTYPQMELNLNMSRIQHGFIRRRGCDTALSELNDKIEQGTINKKFTMAVSVDQRGCFDNINLAYAKKQWENKNLPNDIIEWYFELMNDRTIFSTLNGETVEKKLRRGVGQGLVLSSTCWNLCFDPILRKMERLEPGVTIIAYADDAIILATGACPETLRGIIQRTLNTFVNWGDESGLTFSHEKTEAVIFPPERSRGLWKRPINLKIKGNEVEYGESIKYLGVTFRYDMDWTPYVEERIKKGRNLLFMQRNLVSKTWGVNPKLSKWLYTGIVRPVVTYASHIWSHRTKRPVNTKLEKINRLGCLMIAGVEKSNPTAVLQVIYDILPINLFLRKRSLGTQMRIKNQTRNFWSGESTQGTFSTKAYWNREIVRCNLNINTDKTSIRTKKKDYKLLPLGKPTDLTEKENTIYVYSDGSKMEGRVGFGGVVRENGNVITEFYGQMNTTNTVYQAEVKGVAEGALYIKNMNYSNRNVVFRVDNQAALLSLNKIIIESKLVHRCYTELRKISSKNNVSLEWVKAHSNETPIGNDQADNNAKIGTKCQTTHLETHPPYVYLKNRLDDRIRSEWQTMWNDHNVTGPVLQSRRLIGGPRKDIAKTIDKHDRQTARNMVAMITGHGPNLHNQVNKKYSMTKICRLCLECEDETSWHILCECPALNELRFNTMGFHNCNAPAVHDWDPNNLQRFLKSESIKDIRYNITLQRQPP